MPEPRNAAAFPPLCDRAVRLACAIVEAAPVESLRFAERARMRRALERAIDRLESIRRSLGERETGEKAAPPCRD